MKWQDVFRSWLGSNDFDERPVHPDRWANGTETLEYRLVLGSLSTDPSLAGTANVGPVTSVTPTTTNSTGNTDSSTGGIQAIGSQFSSLSLQQDNSSPNSTSPSQTTTDSAQPDTYTSSNNSTSTSSPDDGLTLTSFNSVGSLPVSSQSSTQESASGNSASTGPATQSGPIITMTPSASTNSANSVSSQSSEASPSSTSTSPPVAIDTSLTAINTNVLVSSAAVAAAKNGAGAAGAKIVR